jgi:UDPglucose 6-dehydrogenase/UDP-N-acetyl-D-galactosamine dehydrogenase
MKHKTVCIVGLAYVGLPLAEAFSKHLNVIGFNIDEEKTRNLGNNKNDKGDSLEFTTDPSLIKQADFVIIAVPTPVTKSNLIYGARLAICQTFLLRKNLY